MAQDDYYYEIQLTNKQLVFYFLAVATFLIMSFLAGVLVGRGVDASAGGEVQAAKPVHEDRIVPEETRPPAPTQDLTYAQRLESDKPAADDLEHPKASPEPAKSKPKAPPAAPKPDSRKAVADASPSASEAATKASPKLPPAAKAPEASRATPTGTFTIQVGAFKDKASAESVVARLKGKGFAAFVTSPEGTDGGLFNVRVGSYQARSDAQRVEKKLRDEEKFQPFIVPQ